jgi:hypothetical protein
MPSVIHHFAADHVRLLTQIGIRGQNRIRVDGSRTGTVLYGPYIHLAPGNYEAAIRFDPAIPCTGRATMDVSADSGQELLAEQTITAEQLRDQGMNVALRFSGAHPLFNVEVRLSCNSEFVAAVQSVEISGELIRSPCEESFELSDFPSVQVQNRIRRGRNPYEGYLRGIGLAIPSIASKVTMDPDFQQARLIAGDRTIVDEANLSNIFLLFKFFVPSLPFGHIVEFGSFKGGSAIFMSVLAQRFLPNAQVLAFDTFAGMPTTDDTVDYHCPGDFCTVDLSDLRDYAERIGLRNLKFVPGRFEETASPTLQEIGRVSLCHIDCDIRSAIEFAYDATRPYMVPGGYWVLDDPLAPTCLGAAEAVEDLLIRRDALNAEQVWPHPVFREPFDKVLPG